MPRVRKGAARRQSKKRIFSIVKGFRGPRSKNWRLAQEAAFSEDAKSVRNSQNKSVVMYAGLLDAMEKAEEALQGLDVERFRQVRRLFDRLYEDARRQAIDTRDQQVLNQAFLLKHFMAELATASEHGLMHGHGEARRRIKKNVDYRRYLLEHHRRHGQ